MESSPVPEEKSYKEFLEDSSSSQCRATTSLETFKKNLRTKFRTLLEDRMED